MARIRSIKPEFFMNEELAEHGPYAALLFAGLWTQADREGRLKDRPKRLKAAILPYYDCDIEDLLEVLTDGFIVRYEVDGKRYIQIVNFGVHQCPNSKEMPSTIPAPCQHSASTVPAHHLLEGKEGKGKEGTREDAPPQSLSNFPECMTTDSWAMNGSGFQTSFAHIGKAIEKRHNRPPTQIELGQIAAAIKSRCPDGCKADQPERCAQLAISRIEKAAKVSTAAKWIGED